MTDENNPTFRDLYEVQDRMDTKVDEVKSDLSKLKIAFAVLVVVTASPKMGGPSATDMVATVLSYVA